MGWELELNAIPPQCSLLDLVVRNAIDAELLTFVRLYFRLRRERGARVNEFSHGSADYERFVDALEEMIARHAGIEYRCCDLERRFDWLRWLLVRCARNGEEERIATQAITGEAPISPSARSTQGFEIRMTSPGQCELIHLWLEELVAQDLRRNYDPSTMIRASLYKWGQPTDPEETFGWIHDDFTSLRRFYRDVSVNSEAVLVVTD